MLDQKGGLNPSKDIDDPIDDESVLGEIYISVPTALTQAEAYGASLSEEVCRLFSHGLLHLAGYDHKIETEAKRMFSMADKYIYDMKRGSGDG